MRHFPPLLFLFLLPTFLLAERTDSLLQVTDAATDDSLVVDAYGELCRELRRSDLEKAVAYGRSGVALATQKGMVYGEAKCRINLGNALIVSGDLTEALRQHLLALELSRKLDHGRWMASGYNNIAVIHVQHGALEKALLNHIEALNTYEQLQDSSGMATSLNNIGVMYYELESFDLALEYYRKSLWIKRSLGQEDRVAVNLNNIGICHRELGRTDSARHYFSQSLMQYRSVQDLEGQAMVLFNLGNLYDALGNHAEARKRFEEAMELSRSLGSKEYIARGYLELSKLSFRAGEIERSLELAEQAVAIASEIGMRKLLKDAHHRMAEAHERLGRPRLALEHFKRSSELRDSLFAEEMSDRLTSLQVRLETEQIEQKMEVLRVENAAQQAQIRQEKVIRNITALLLILALAVVVMAAYAYKRKQRDNALLEEKNRIIAQSREDIITSISYAHRIQRAVLPSEEYFTEIWPGSMLFHRPKDIVSGDFFWTMESGEWRYVAVADCTGHGVPGAFVSIIGNTELSKAVRSVGQQGPAAVLTKLNDAVGRVFEDSSDADKGLRDGMDIALCAIDKSGRQLTFAGANRPVYIVSQHNRASGGAPKDLSEGDHQLRVYRGTRRPIGCFPSEVPFQEHRIDLLAGDRIFMFSDGLPDQFGGPEDKKFGYRRMKQLLLEMAAIPKEEQAGRLTEVVDQWKNDSPQTDDMCVVGMTV